MCRVMVVDDNPDQVELTVHILESRGDEVEGYCDPFLALASAIEKNPDVIIVDQMMPFLEGSQLIREMKKAGVKAKYILLSGLERLYEHPDTRNGLADRYLKKPLPNDELFQEVHSVLAV